MEAIDNPVDEAVTVISLSGELDASDISWADDIGHALDGGHDQLVIDLRDVTFIDSSFVRELLIARRRVGPDGWLRVVYTHHLIKRVIDICGLTDVFPQFTTVDAATRDAPRRTEGGWR